MEDSSKETLSLGNLLILTAKEALQIYLARLNRLLLTDAKKAFCSFFSDFQKTSPNAVLMLALQNK
jgi:hypothetical protein